MYFFRFRAFIDNTCLQIITLDDNLKFSNLPNKLFHGNPDLMEVSMCRNNLNSLDAAHFPLDRLHRLKLAGNPFVCNCSLLWLWRLTNGQLDQNINGIKSNSSGTNTAAVVNYHKNINNSSNSSPLVLDVDDIVCDVIDSEDSLRNRRHMKNMSASDIKCPAHIVTMVSGIISVTIIILTGSSVLFYIRRMKSRRNAMSERKNVNEPIVPQQVDKLELERYLAAQAVENEYRALHQWEMMKEQIEEADHYEKFDELRFETRRSQKPQVVYV